MPSLWNGLNNRPKFVLSTDWLKINVIFARYSLKFVYRNSQTKVTCLPDVYR